MTSVTTLIETESGDKASRGVYAQADGSWLAMTFTVSRAFKTKRAAQKWLERMIGSAE